MIKQLYDAKADNINTRNVRSRSPVVSARHDLSRDINLNEANQIEHTNCYVQESNLTPSGPPTIPTENKILW